MPNSNLRSRIGGRQASCKAMVPHLPLLMGTNAHFASRHGAAKQNVTFCLIFCEIGIGMIVFDGTFEQSSSTGETTPVMTNRRQYDSVDGGRVPDVFLFPAIKIAETFGGFHGDPKATPLFIGMFRHLRFDALRVIEAAVLAVRRLSRLAPAEVS